MRVRARVVEHNSVFFSLSKTASLTSFLGVCIGFWFIPLLCLYIFHRLVIVGFTTSSFFWGVSLFLSYFFFINCNSLGR